MDKALETTFKVGNRVSYEDMANPRRCGRITERIHSRWGTEWRVVWDDGTETVSDLKQAGWRSDDS